MSGLAPGRPGIHKKENGVASEPAAKDVAEKCAHYKKVVMRIYVANAVILQAGHAPSTYITPLLNICRNSLDSLPWISRNCRGSHGATGRRDVVRQPMGSAG